MVVDLKITSYHGKKIARYFRAIAGRSKCRDAIGAIDAISRYCAAKH